ncbi:MAG: hypothetical protein M0Z79_09260 [Nitrospiraceae bacterium]|nr:hypothetical protein [Nitrospiraceae bacterium]
MMRIILGLFITALVFAAACDKKQPNPVEEYGTGLLDARAKAQDAAAKANLDAVRQAVQAYRAANDAYPANLQDAAGLIGQQVDLSKYDYDPQTGAVRLK